MLLVAFICFFFLRRARSQKQYDPVWLSSSDVRSPLPFFKGIESNGCLPLNFRMPKYSGGVYCLV
jgi:hypothetical protein